IPRFWLTVAMYPAYESRRAQSPLGSGLADTPTCRPSRQINRHLRGASARLRSTCISLPTDPRPRASTRRPRRSGGGGGVAGGEARAVAAGELAEGGFGVAGGHDAAPLGLEVGVVHGGGGLAGEAAGGGEEVGVGGQGVERLADELGGGGGGGGGGA